MKFHDINYNNGYDWHFLAKNQLVDPWRPAAPRLRASKSVMQKPCPTRRAKGLDTSSKGAALG